MNRFSIFSAAFLFILIFAFSTSHLLSQDTTESAILVEIPDSLTEDRDRVDYMIMASWGARLSDREKAFEIGRMAIDSAKIKEVKDLEGLAYNLMGILFMQSINYDSAEFYYAQAEETAIAIKDSDC